MLRPLYRGSLSVSEGRCYSRAIVLTIDHERSRCLAHASPDRWDHAGISRGDTILMLVFTVVRFGPVVLKRLVFMFPQLPSGRKDRVPQSDGFLKRSI